MTASPSRLPNTERIKIESAANEQSPLVKPTVPMYSQGANKAQPIPKEVPSDAGFVRQSHLATTLFILILTLRIMCGSKGIQLFGIDFYISPQISSSCRLLIANYPGGKQRYTTSLCFSQQAFYF